MPGTSTLDRAASRAPSVVKDAYAAWLSQLDGDDAADKVLATLQPRRQHRSRAERIAQIEHAQQSTAASSLKRSAVAVAVDSNYINGASQVHSLALGCVKEPRLKAVSPRGACQPQEDSDAVRLPAIEMDKTASLQRRRQALADQASYVAMNSYSPDLAPGLAFLARLADAAAAGTPPFCSASSTAFDANATHTEGARVRDYELPNFPVQIVPTLLRVDSSPQHRNRRRNPSVSTDGP